MKSFTPEENNFTREHFLKEGLSKSEVEVAIYVIRGLTNREVAQNLCVAEKTIKFHLGNVYKKLKIFRRSELIWKLPLQEFVNISNKSNITQSHFLKEDNMQTHTENTLQSGSSKVSDMEDSKIS